MKTFFINLLAFGTLISSVITITSKNPVISVIHLITTFVQAAGFLILIGINFVGISYIVVYVGAIAVLFLFVIMMINIKLTDILETGVDYSKNLPLAIAIVFLSLLIFYTILQYNLNNIPAFSIILNKITNLNTLFYDLNYNNIMENYEKLDFRGKIALGLLLLNYVLISSLISIIFIFYGDYLIKKYQIEVKYPKLAKLISLRRTFQKYYLIMDSLIIISVILIEIIFCIAILFF